MAMKQGWLDPDFLGQQIHQSEMKKSGIGASNVKGWPYSFKAAGSANPSTFGCSIFHQPGRLIRCIFHDSYDSTTWQPGASIPTEHLGVACYKGPSALPFVVFLIYEESMYKQEPCWPTHVKANILASHQPLAPEINWTTWVFLPKYEWNIFKPSKNGVFACLLYMMTREINPTAEKRPGPARAIPLLRRAIPNNVPGAPRKLTDLTHETFTFYLSSQLVRRKVSIK